MNHGRGGHAIDERVMDHGVRSQDVATDSSTGFDILIRAFLDAQECDRVWELSPDGVLSPDADDVLEQPTVSVRRRVARLELTTETDGRSIPQISSRCHSLEFLPDELRLTTMTKHRNLAAQLIPWEQIQASAGTVSFLERGRIPEDAHVQSRVQPPDERSEKAPRVVTYGSVTLTAAPDFRRVWHFSRLDAARDLFGGLLAVGAQRR